MSEFYKLQIGARRQLTSESVELILTVPANLKTTFAFESGQYVNIKVYLDGAEQRRSYSICSAPHENELRIAIKEQPNGVVSSFLCQDIVQGDWLEVQLQEGRFINLYNRQPEPLYVMIAGGSGITPIISIMKSILHLEKFADVRLFYANRSLESAMFQEELVALSAIYPNKLRLYNIFSEGQGTEQANEISDSYLFNGRLTREKIIGLLARYSVDRTESDYFICGPQGLMDIAQEALETLKVDEELIHREYFEPPTQEVVVKNTFMGQTNLTILLDDESTEVTIKGNKTILEAAEAAGVDAPFSCRGGVCSTCQAQVTEGKAVMDQNHILTDDEIEEGYVLTCQARCTTEKVVVNYDWD